MGQFRQKRLYQRERKLRQIPHPQPFHSRVKQLTGAALFCRWTRSGRIQLYKPGTHVLLLYLTCQRSRSLARFQGTSPTVVLLRQRQRAQNQPLTKHCQPFSKTGLMSEPELSCSLSFFKSCSFRTQKSSLTQHSVRSSLFKRTLFMKTACAW